MGLLPAMFIFGLLMAATEAAWSEPVPLHADEYSGISPGISTPRSGSESDILLALTPREQMDKYASYGFREYADTLQPFKIIDNDRDCIYGALLFGATNDQELYTVSVGARNPKSSTAECDTDITTGCSEVIFRESKDGGETWSPLVFAPRKNMTDLMHRKGASIIKIKDTGRIYIFYSKHEVFGKSTISFITRPESSSIFSAEVDIVKLPARLTDFAVISAATVVKGRQVLHVAWNQNGDLMYTSTENGITWDTPKTLAQIASLSQNFAAAQFMTFQESSDTICIAFVTSAEHQGQILCGKGKLSASTVYTVPISAGLSYVSTGICQHSSKAVIVSRTADETIRAFEFNLGGRNIKELEAPFAGKFMYEFPQVSCEVSRERPSELLLRVVAYERREQKEYLTIANIDA